MRTDSHFDPSKGKTELRYCCKLCDYSTLRRWNVQRHIIRHNQEDLTKAAAASSSSSSSPRGGAWSQDQSPSYLGLDLADKGQIESRVRLKVGGQNLSVWNCVITNTILWIIQSSFATFKLTRHGFDLSSLSF